MMLISFTEKMHREKPICLRLFICLQAQNPFRGVKDSQLVQFSKDFF